MKKLLLFTFFFAFISCNKLEKNRKYRVQSAKLIKAINTTLINNDNDSINKLFSKKADSLINILENKIDDSLTIVQIEQAWVNLMIEANIVSKLNR